jgi:hypothetical protein
MQALSQSLDTWVGGLSVVPLLLLLGLALFIWVMSRNFGSLRRERWFVDLRPGEKEIDRLEVVRPLQIIRTLVTDRRILQQRLHWLFSRRRLIAVELSDVHSIGLKSSISYVPLILGLWLIGKVNPLAFLLVLYSFQAPITSLRFATVFSKMPLTRPRIRVAGHRWGPSVAQFYAVARFALQRFRASASGGWSEDGLHQPQAVDHRDVFRWDRLVWVYLAALMAAGALQRLEESHLAFDDLVFAPLYLGLPVAAVRRSLTGGVWVALLGFVGLFTIKFPSGGLLGQFALRADGVPHYRQMVLTLACLAFIVIAANLLKVYLHPRLWFLGLLMWVPFVWWVDRSSFESLLFVGQLLAAMAVAFIGSWLYGMVGGGRHAAA